MHGIGCLMVFIVKIRDDLVHHRIRIALKVSRPVKFTVGLIANKMHIILERVYSTLTVCNLSSCLQEVFLLLDE